MLTKAYTTSLITHQHLYMYQHITTCITYCVVSVNNLTSAGAHHDVIPLIHIQHFNALVKYFNKYFFYI